MLTGRTNIFVCCNIRISCNRLLIFKSICQFIHCLSAIQNLRVTRVLKNGQNYEFLIKNGLTQKDIHNEMVSMLGDGLHLQKQ